MSYSEEVCSSGAIASRARCMRNAVVTDPATNVVLERRVVFFLRAGGVLLRNWITRGFKGIVGCRPPFFEVLSDSDEHRSFAVFFVVKVDL